MVRRVWWVVWCTVWVVLVGRHSSNGADGSNTCPVTAMVNIGMTGRIAEFSSNSSFLGSAIRAAHTMGLEGGSGCDSLLCVAGRMAEYARYTAFSGCSYPEGTVDVIQVGANDGGIGDPLFPWLSKAEPWVRAVLLEPIQSSFVQLVTRYASSQATIYFAHLALQGEGQGTRQMYIPTMCDGDDPGKHTRDRHYLMTEGLTDEQKELCYKGGFFYGNVATEELLPISQVASFEYDHVHDYSKWVGGSLDGPNLISAHPVASTDWSTLLETHGATQSVGLVLIDAEGQDCDLVLSFPFHRLKPDAVVFEFGHQQCSGPKLHQVLAFLELLGYERGNFMGAEHKDASFVLRSQQL